MINKDIWSYGPHEFRDMDTTVRGLLGRKTDRTFRLDDNTSVGLELYGISQPVPPSFGITLRERVPVKDIHGIELYPYKRVMVSFNDRNPLYFTEVAGVQARNKRGILKEWRGGQDFSKIEKLKKSETSEVRRKLARSNPVPINPEPYVDALYQLKAKDREDVYGRIPSEQRREKAVVEAFEEESQLLLQPDLYNSFFDQPLVEGMFGDTRQRSRRLQQQSHYLPYGNAFLLVREERRGFARLAKETVVYQVPYNPTGTIWQYERRKVDNRLVATTYAGRQALADGIGYGPNPLEAVYGEIVVDLLTSV